MSLRKRVERLEKIVGSGLVEVYPINKEGTWAEYQDIPLSTAIRVLADHLGLRFRKRKEREIVEVVKNPKIQRTTPE